MDEKELCEAWSQCKCKTLKMEIDYPVSDQWCIVNFCDTYWISTSYYSLRAILRLLLETRGHEAPEGECSKQSNTAWWACSK